MFISILVSVSSPVLVFPRFVQSLESLLPAMEHIFATFNKVFQHFLSQILNIVT